MSVQPQGRLKPLPSPPTRSRRYQSLGYRAKRVLLGRPLQTTELVHERISKRVALAAFSSDPISSTAYATEEICWCWCSRGGRPRPGWRCRCRSPSPGCWASWFFCLELTDLVDAMKERGLRSL